MEIKTKVFKAFRKGENRPKYVAKTEVNKRIHQIAIWENEDGSLYLKITPASATTLKKK
jgi:hypothetical protein